jgi:hypothetical protein
MISGYAVRMALQRATKEFSNDQLWDYKRAMVRHLARAASYHSLYGTCIPNKHDGTGPDVDRRWKEDLQDIIATCNDWTTAMDNNEAFLLEDGSLDVVRHKEFNANIESMWNKIVEFVRLDADNLWY